MERKTVTLALLGSFVLIVADKAFRNKTPKPRVLIGLGIAFVFIGVAAEYNPEIAASFALLIFIALLLERGEFVFGKATKALGG